MRIEDLMVGDWVICTYPSINKPVKVMEIKTVSDKELKAVINNDGIRLVFRGTYIDPIPLTPEILEKNGFIKDKGNEYSITYHILIPTGYEKNSYTIQITFYKVPLAGVNVLFKCWGWLPPDNCGMNDIHICNVEYVHNFQHALKLCGIEKEIQI